jgi:hypothetical protein
LGGPAARRGCEQLALRGGAVRAARRRGLAVRWGSSRSRVARAPLLPPAALGAGARAPRATAALGRVWRASGAPLRVGLLPICSKFPNRKDFGQRDLQRLLTARKDREENNVTDSVSAIQLRVRRGRRRSRASQGRVEHGSGAIPRFLERFDRGSPVAAETVGSWYWIVGRSKKLEWCPSWFMLGEQR